MGKNRKWQFACIIAVTLLTVYNILPTLFYYLKPLHQPICKEQGESMARSIEKRVDHLEKESVEWLSSFCDLIEVNPSKISLDANHPQWISIAFRKTEDAAKFRSLFPRAASLIPSPFAKLFLNMQKDDPKTVEIQRQIPISLQKHSDLFTWASKKDSEYQNLILDRASQIAYCLAKNGKPSPSESVIQAILTQEHRFKLGDKNPVFSDVSIDFAKEKIILSTHASEKKKSNELLVKEIAKIGHLCHEKVEPSEEGFEIPFHTLANTSGSLVLHLDQLADLEMDEIIYALNTQWHPKHPDLQNIPIVKAPSYANLPLEEQSLCVILFSPFFNSAKDLDNSSLYLSLKGLERIAKSYDAFPDTALAHLLQEDLQNLYTILHQSGFGKSSHASPFSGDLLLEKPNFAGPLLAATREEFRLMGSQKYAVLDTSTLEGRILTENKIETAIHQELVKWQDDFLSAQVSLNPKTRFDIPKPKQSVFWSNLSLSLRKMIRGDERKIIRWGLDLSGGKTVEIELRDMNNKVVQSDEEIRQGMKELYDRVNKMGLSEVAIRQVGQHIVLDFPGSQSLSASELIKASTLHFHVVNEKFSPRAPLLGAAANKFLQAVWDEAVFTGKKDSESLSEIAAKHLRDTEEGKLLQENGLKFAKDGLISEEDSLSKIAVQRGSSPLEWGGMPHPLMIVFHSPALEGSHLENIHAGYDPSRGNYLSFGIASSFQNKEGVKISPQNILYKWTSRYSKENIIGSPHESYSQGRGWRMAAVLNDTVISAPTLDSALKTGGTITGSFSQDEVQHLSQDLKAGSLTFTPHILSEKNVSPELGKNDRAKGIIATLVALALVIGCMIAYYRFAGLIASLAVLFNLLILWGTLQNLGATLTLAGIAGIILTVGMSIDANVLVFERIKEEFAITGRIQSAIHAGYSKAFSAIIDSNITTIIAALILLNFDAGPIKSFAINLIIGIASSMFTALFVTRVYFTSWAQNPKNKVLNMANWLRTSRFDFLKQTKAAFITALIVIGSGCSLLFFKSSSILGLDFTGGYALHIELEQTEEGGYAEKVQKALLGSGAETRDFLIQEMNPSQQLRILFGQSMEQSGKPFFGLPLEIEKEEAEPLYQKNPRISWVVNALKSSGLTLSPKSEKELHADWTAVSGQMSNAMRNHAIFGFLLSFVGIFIYLAFRFEYKFAAAAIICLIHDVFITLAIMGLLHAFGVPIQIDLITIAALMTAVGYSLNDTIIIFDRIREEMQINEKRGLKETVNYALNFTLSRTMITSGTTLLVLLALLILGGASIFGFALVMTIGVVFGTLSSWFIAAPLMLFFHDREEKKSMIGKEIKA